jgi:hypothetical protein
VGDTIRIGKPIAGLRESKRLGGVGGEERGEGRGVLPIAVCCVFCERAARLTEEGGGRGEGGEGEGEGRGRGGVPCCPWRCDSCAGGVGRGLTEIHRFSERAVCNNIKKKRKPWGLVLLLL